MPASANPKPDLGTGLSFQAPVVVSVCEATM